jgi:hypothetical protein
MDNALDKNMLLQALTDLLIKTNQEPSYTHYKFLMDKHKEEWPELWYILDDLMYVTYIEDKFIDPR